MTQPPGPDVPEFRAPGDEGEASGVYPPPGYPTSGYPTPGYPTPGYPPPGYPPPGVPGYPPPGYQAPGYPPADVPENGTVPGGQVWTNAAARRELVGRGLLFSLPAVILGAVLAAILYRFGFIASITSFAMVVAAGWLYTRGAGTSPRAGLVGFIAVVVGGIVLSLFAMLGTELYAELAADYPDASAGDLLSVVFDNLLYPGVWGVFLKDALIFVLFGALGVWSTLRQLRRQRTTP